MSTTKTKARRAEYREIRIAGGTLGSYVPARQAGATHAECLEVLAAGDTLYRYASVRRAGGTHAEYFEGLAAGGTLRGYASAREAGATHAECLVLVKAICLEPRDFAVVLGAYRELSKEAQSTPTVLEVICGLGGADWTQDAHTLAVAALACTQ